MMNWLDLAIIVVFIIAVVRGIQNGFVRQIFADAGFVAGIFVGAWAQNYFIGLAHSADTKAIISLSVILACTLTLMILFELIGTLLKKRLKEARFVDRADRALGSLVGAAVVVLGVWLGAAVFANTPYKAVQQQIRSSRIVIELNNTLPDAPGVIAKIGHFINPNDFPQVFSGLEPQLKTDAPLPELGELLPAVEHTKASVVKIAGRGCGGIVEGSGFVARAGTVVTNAHVVAGVERPVIVDANGQHNATVVWFDPKLDIAILRTEGLAGEPLNLNSHPISSGTAGVVLGYPEGQGFTASPAVILESFWAEGRDIYNQSATERSVYSVKSDIRHGNSGGPLIAADGSVVGVIFADSVTYPDIGYALTVDQAIYLLEISQNKNEGVSTGRCAQ